MRTFYPNLPRVVMVALERVATKEGMLDAKQIEQVPLFAGLDKRERARVAQHADEIDVPEGKRLAREGDLAYEFFVIREGTADVDVVARRRTNSALTTSSARSAYSRRSASA